MKISKIVKQKINGSERISGLIGDDEVWLESKTGHALFESPDAFVAAALIPAMLTKQDINLETDLHISQVFLSNLNHAQNILSLWYPQLHVIKIHAQTEECNTPTQAGVGSFFSGGADGSYTFLANKDQITHLVFVEGIDIQLENTSLLNEVIETNRKYAANKGKEFVLIRSNIRNYITGFDMSWVIANAAGLAFIAHALSFRKMFFAGSHSVQGLFAWGSHPMLDHWFSNEIVEIIHDAAEVKRTEKIRKVSEDPDTLNILRVCWHDSGYNCGKCEKCLRTMLTLRLLKADTNTFPDLISLNPLKSIRLYTEAQHLFFQENLDLALTTNDHEVVKALRKIDKQHKIRKALSTLELAWFGGKLKKILRLFIKLKP